MRNSRNQQPFRVYVRREGGYELSLTVRFEATDGHGILALQRRKNKETAPALVHEESEVGPTELRGGRFIHVLGSSGRRQSYALSRLAEDVLERLPDDHWIQLEPLTEYGFRYLVAPDAELLPAQGGKAAAQVAVPTAGVAVAAPRSTPRPSAPRDPELTAARPSGAPSALQRAMAAIRSTRPPDRPQDTLSRRTPRPAPTASVSAGLRSPPGPPPTGDATSLQARIEDLERRLAESLKRERDLLDLLAKWQERS